MPKSERNPNAETRITRRVSGVSDFGFRISFGLRPSGFGFLLCALLCRSTAAAPAASQSSNDYSSVDAIFSAHCLDCHGTQDPEGQFVLESFESLMKGGELGAAIVPGQSAESLLVQMVEGRFEKDGKKKIMPPGKRAKLTPEQIATIKNWIDAGANPPATVAAPRQLAVPKISPKGTPRRPITALAYSAQASLVAVALFGEVELRSPSNLNLVRTLSGESANFNALCFSPDGARLFAAGGQPGLSGEIRQWNVADGRLIRTISGHKDAIYALALSPDGKLLATGSYDQKIKLWNAETGQELKTLSGHNGCVYHLAFRPDGKILASASADRTVKLWDVASGERRDTLSQSLKELYALAFSPDGKRLAAGGADNRIRVWEVSENAAETTNPILYSKFAHEGAILNLVFSADGKTLVSSADDRTVKIWDAEQMQERSVLEKQPDWPPALTFVGDDRVIVGRLDGSISVYQTATGKLLTSVAPIDLITIPPWVERWYSVLGAVKSPNRYHYVGPTTVLKAIQSAGDLTDFSSGSKVRLTRSDGTTLSINYRKAVNDPRLDLPVYPGDTVSVARRIW